MDFSLSLGVLEAGLKLWNTKEGKEYLEKVIKLKGQYYEELSKPEDERSQLTLDTCLLKLTIIAQSFVQHPVKSE